MNTFTYRLSGLFIMLTFLISCSTSKQLDKDTKEWRYQLEAVNTGIQGTYQVKVWTYTRKAEWAEAQASKNAVHGVLFKGFPTKDRVKGQRPLVTEPDAYKQHEEFFESFFADGGEYNRFVTMIDTPAPGDFIRVGKEYKVGQVASVSVTELRKYLEANKIIKALDSGF